jgi:membrane-associated phospholipid phosphatase
MRKIFKYSKGSLVVGTLAIATLCGNSHVERTGDYLQIALPVAAFTCSVANGEALSNFLRFATVTAVVHGAKHSLNDTPINLRPSGSAHGFPSGHTAAAAFGASSLVNSCVKKNPWIQGIAILSGGFVGVSRIEAGAHFLFQVICGALLGWLGERSVHIFRMLRLIAQYNIRRAVRWIKVVA